MSEVEKKVNLVKLWLSNYNLDNHSLDVKYITDTNDCLEVEISNSKLIWSVLVNKPEFAPYANVWIEILDLNDVDNYLKLSWGDNVSTMDNEIIRKLDETIEMLFT